MRTQGVSGVTKKVEPNDLPTVSRSASRTVAVQIPRIEIQTAFIEIVGLTPLLSHRWSDEQISAIRDKQQGKPKQPKEAKNPFAEFHSSLYPIGPNGAKDLREVQNGRYGMRAACFKKATIGAVGALQDKQTFSMTLAKKLFFIEGCEEAPDLVEILFDQIKMREDPVTVGMGTDLRYRAEFHGWSATLKVKFLTCLKLEQMAHLINLGGFCCGIGDWRPEKGGIHGTYQVKEQ